jgi:hypothetical protein
MGARGVGLGSRGCARLVDRLFTPLRAQRVLLDACFSAIGRRRALFVVCYARFYHHTIPEHSLDSASGYLPDSPPEI